MLVHRLLLREFNDIYHDHICMGQIDDVYRVTGCQKPCRYRRYTFVGEKKATYFESKHFVFGLLAFSKFTEVETEQLIYPVSSLVAEFGGTLGLFLGFSFMALWDGLPSSASFIPAKSC